MATVAGRRRSLESQAATRRKPVEEPDQGRPFWQVVGLLYGAIFFLAALLTAVCFLSAWLAAGKPY
jgi:hypothetical protein